MCDYKGCKRPTVSGGGIITDADGEIYDDIELCEFHVNKIIGIQKNA